MRVVCLVPSWTETLISAGISVVGRTRYCIHPESQVSEIPVVGGTKDVDWEKIKSLDPDWVIVDREENRSEIQEKYQGKWIASHVESVSDVCKEIEKMAEALGLESEHELFKIAQRWEHQASRDLSFDLENIPGVLQWIHPIDQGIKNIRYIIWKKPWMSVNQKTFIGSMIEHLGFKNLIPILDEKYPKLSDDHLSAPNTLYLFSSEPYPFGSSKELENLKALKVPSALVDGELYSWFGVRSLMFLESL